MLFLFFIFVSHWFYTINITDMSFEDDMLEEGFSNEQDYMDYLCRKADSRRIYDNEEDLQWELERQKNAISVFSSGN